MGAPNDVEAVKRDSRQLRGTIAESLENGGTHFDDADAQLLKFHGIYQQEDRDARQARKAAGLEPAYQFMLRSRIPGGALTPEQYLAHDDLADRVSNGSLRITTRQGIQLHGILKGNLRTAIGEINASLITTIAACGDVNRNVMACPAPAKTAFERTVQQLAHDLAQHFTPHTRAYHEIWIDGEKLDSPQPENAVDPMYGPTYLPRKFKMGIALPGDNCIDVFTQDIGFIARLSEGEVQGYTIVVGGGMGMTHGKATTYPRLASPFCFVPTDKAVEVAEAILTVQRDYGDRTNRKHARFKYLVEERGVAWLRAQVQSRLGYELALPLETRCADVHDHLGWSAASDGVFTLGIYVPNGRVADTHRGNIRSGLRAVIERFRPQIRLTPQQNILLLGIRAASVATVTSLLHEHGIATQPGSLGLHRYAMACPALPTCGLALTDAERALPDVVDAIAADLGRLGLREEPLSIRMTGCPNGCARPYMGDIGFVGRSKDLYDIFLGGDWANTRLNWLYKSSVRRSQLVDELRPLFAVWKHERAGSETFGDYCTRAGRERLLALAEIPA